MVLKGYGAPEFILGESDESAGQRKRGDHIIKFKVVIPKSLSEK
jgi:DnaJ-class molecular chaperone